MSRRLLAPLSEWSAADVVALIDERIEEGQRLEYKRGLDLDDRKQRAEAAKDVSGMANARGGILIYGVAEEELPDGRRLPAKPMPLDDGKAQARLEDVLDSSVSPSVNIEPRLLETDGGFFLVVRAFPRLGIPHMVEAYNDNRCYVRAGLKTRPMTQRELEDAFQMAVQSEQRATRRMARLPLVPALEDVRAGADKVVAQGPWASVIALAIDASDPLLAMRNAGSSDFPDDGGYPRWSGRSHGGPFFGWDDLGYRDERTTADGVLIGRIRLYRSGVFEWGRTYSASTPEGTDERYIACRSFADETHDVVAYFATVCRRVGYFGRLRIWIALDGVRGTRFPPPRGAIDDGITTDAEHIEWSGIDNVERVLSDLTPLMHQAMDRFWVAYGYSRCPYFDEAGNYIPAR